MPFLIKNINRNEQNNLDKSKRNGFKKYWY